MRFRAEVRDAGPGGHVVPVPAELTAALSGRRVPVLARVNGVPYRSRVAVHGGRAYLALRVAWLRELGVDPGDEVEVELHEEPPAPEVAEPAELTAALAEVPGARVAFDALEAVAGTEYRRWVAAAADPATRRDRAARVVRRLRSRG